MIKVRDDEQMLYDDEPRTVYLVEEGKPGELLEATLCDLSAGDESNGAFLLRNGLRGGFRGS